MYRAFFGLRERPFELTPNPRFLYLTGRHREALSNLHYGILGRKGITLLVGEAGTGKTTLLRAALEALAGRQVQSIYVSNPSLTRPEFYELLAGRFGLGAAAATSKARFLGELEELLVTRFRAGIAVALVIDEAQSLPAELMEEVRLLANLETDTDRLLSVVLAGQPELALRLEREDMRQLKQRVALRCELGPLDLAETASYISGRMAIAGGDGAKVFTREAVQAIYEWSGGIPRTISVICDNSLVTAFAAEEERVTQGIVLEVCRDFRLRPIHQGVVPPAASGVTAGDGVFARPEGRPRGGSEASPARGWTPRPVVRPAVVPSEAAPQAPAKPGDEPTGRAQPAAEPERNMFGLFTKKKRFRFF